MKNIKILLVCILVLICISIVLLVSYKSQTVQVSLVSVSGLSNKKIGWGIKRVKDHIQPDLGLENKQLIDKYQGMAMGNKDKKVVYLTFDNGYEAGYTPQILKALKDNNVKATFFLAGHYINSASDLVKQMIDEGHIIRKSHS